MAHMPASSLPYGDWGTGLMDKIKLQWRMFAFLLGFCTLLLVVLWLMQTVFLNSMYKMVRRMEMEQAIAMVGRSINSPDFQNVLVTLEDTKEIFVSFAGERTLPHRRGPEKQPKMEITQIKSFTMEDGQTISLKFNAVITPVNATLTTLKLQLYIVTGIMIILSVLLALLISKKVSTPIAETNKSAKALASGNYDVSFKGHGFLEIRELSDTLNTAAKELGKAENLRRELMANISHDLRTPLALIYSYAEVMHDFPDEVSQDKTQIIMDETKRLSSLVNDIMDVSRLETGTMEINKKTYSLTENIKQTIERVGELVRKDGYRLTFDYQEEVYVNADEIKISQAFYNLLINAINYSVIDKDIVIRQISRNGFIRIEIKDHGCGIAPEDLPYIWDRYYKVDKTHKRGIAGTGLGLSIVKKIIYLHGGTCGAESSQDKGSVFWFQLKFHICKKTG